MKSMNLLITALMLSSMPLGLFANDKACDSLTSAAPTGEFGFISPGLTWIDMKNVNTSLADLQLSSFPDKAWTISLGHHAERGRMISEEMATVRVWGDNRDSGYRTSLYMGDLRSRCGVNVLPRDLPVNAFPYFGLGVGINALHFRSNEKTISNLLVAAEPNTIIYQATALLDLGLGSELKFFDKKGGGGVVGLRIGYLLDLYKNKKWVSEGVRVTGISSISQSGPYINLVFGGWDKTHGKHKHESCPDSSLSTNR